jgi:DNA-binding XRE family transcriptional regulator
MFCLIRRYKEPRKTQECCSRHITCDGIYVGKSKRAPRGELLRFMLEHMNDKNSVLWPYARNKAGYAVIYSKEKGRLVRVHQIVCEIVHGPKPFKGSEVRHLCGKGNEGCFNAKCLYWGTRKQNRNDRVIHGTDDRGEKHSSHKLITSDIIEIRKLRGKLSQRELAKIFEVSRSHIYRIQNNKTWKHINNGVV